MALAEKINFMVEGLGTSQVGVILNKVPSEKAKQRMREAPLDKCIKPLGSAYFNPEFNESSFEGIKLGDSKTDLDMKIITDLSLQEAG